MEQKEMIPIFRVTKGNTDGSIYVGDRVYYSPNGSLVQVGLGWLRKDELTQDITDFKYEIDEMYEVCVDKHGEYIVRKGECNGTCKG